MHKKQTENDVNESFLPNIETEIHCIPINDLNVPRNTAAAFFAAQHKFNFKITNADGNLRLLLNTPQTNKLRANCRKSAHKTEDG